MPGTSPPCSGARAYGVASQSHGFPFCLEELSTAWPVWPGVSLELRWPGAGGTGRGGIARVRDSVATQVGVREDCERTLGAGCGSSSVNWGQLVCSGPQVRGLAAPQSFQACWVLAEHVLGNGPGLWGQQGSSRLVAEQPVTAHSSWQLSCRIWTVLHPAHQRPGQEWWLVQRAQLAQRCGGKQACRCQRAARLGRGRSSLRFCPPEVHAVVTAGPSILRHLYPRGNPRLVLCVRGLSVSGCLSGEGRLLQHLRGTLCPCHCDSVCVGGL